jgi:hypothetical protein
VATKSFKQVRVFRGITLEIFSILVHADDVSPLDSDGGNLVCLNGADKVAEDDIFVLFLRFRVNYVEDKKPEKNQ